LHKKRNRGPGSAKRHEECRVAPGTRDVQSGIQFHARLRLPWLRHHRQRWLRHDAHLWVRPDAARFFPPGTDPAVINPTLPRKPDAAKAAAFESELQAEVAKGYRLNAALRAEVAEVKADMARRRAAYSEESKYSPSQPRVPAGNPDGGQWTDRGGGGRTVAKPSQDTGQDIAPSLAQPMGNVGIGDVSGSSEIDDLFRIKPNDTRVGGIEVGGDVIKVCIASGISSWKDDFGIKRYTVTYDCAGGRSFTRSWVGNYHGIVRDPFR
jgi:hypothetical protein